MHKFQHLISITRSVWWLGLVALLFVTAACSSSGGTPMPIDEHGDTAPRLSVAEAKQLVDAGEAVLVDTRSAAQFEQERAAGAVLAPLSEIEANPDLPAITQIPKDQEMILYCT